MRYARKKPKSCDEYEDFLFFQYNTQMPVVFEGEEYEDTGILDEDGNEIVRFVGVLPIGFLADQSED